MFKDLFYTLQVCWDGGEGLEGSGFYLKRKKLEFLNLFTEIADSEV